MNTNYVKLNLLSAATICTLAFSSHAGVSTGNATDFEIPFHGRRENVTLTTRPKPKWLATNKIKIKNLHFSRSDYAKKLFLMATTDFRILGLYQFPTDSRELEKLYKAAYYSIGDFSSLDHPNNPFSRYLTSKTLNRDYLFGDQDLIEPNNIQKLTDQVNLNFQVSINEELQNGNCHGICTEDDFKPFPKDGIRFMIECSVSNMAKHGPWESFVLPQEVTLRSPRDQIDIRTSVLAKEAVEYMHYQVCDNPNAARWLFHIRCHLLPINENERTKSLSVFDLSLFSILDWKPTVISANISSLGEERYTIATGSTDHISFDEETKLAPRFLFGDYREVVGYRFVSTYRSVYGRSEAEFADYVRRAFVSSYQKLTKESAWKEQ